MQTKYLALALLAFAVRSAGAANVTFNVIYDFNTPGSLTGTPTYIVEVSPGKFMGTAANGAEIFSVTSDGTYNNIYVFPPVSSGFSVFGLTPALNNQVYGSGEALGDSPTISELYSVEPDDKVAVYPYKPPQAADNHLYSLFSTGNSLELAQLDYQGNPTPLYLFTESQIPL